MTTTDAYRQSLAQLYRQAVALSDEIARRLLSAQIEEELGLVGLIEIKLLALSPADVQRS